MNKTGIIAGSVVALLVAGKFIVPKAVGFATGYFGVSYAKEELSINSLEEEINEQMPIRPDKYTTFNTFSIEKENGNYVFRYDGTLDIWLMENEENIPQGTIGFSEMNDPEFGIKEELVASHSSQLCSDDAVRENLDSGFTYKYVFSHKNNGMPILQYSITANNCGQEKLASTDPLGIWK